MLNIERELERYLTLLRNKIREKNYTQLEVQEALGWGRSYISQLVTKQKSLRIEQVLAICSVIGVDAKEFFSELYSLPTRPGARPSRQLSARRLPELSSTDQELAKMAPLLRGIAQLLIDKGLITTDDLSRVVQEEAGPEFPSLS